MRDKEMRTVKSKKSVLFFSSFNSHSILNVCIGSVNIPDQKNAKPRA